MVLLTKEAQSFWRKLDAITKGVLSGLRADPLVKEVVETETRKQWKVSDANGKLVIYLGGTSFQEGGSIDEGGTLHMSGMTGDVDEISKHVVRRITCRLDYVPVLDFS
jgi:hypothetical protein